MTTVDHREVVATDNHPFLVLRKVGRLRSVQWLPLDDIHVGDEIAVSGLIPDHGRPYELPVDGPGQAVTQPLPTHRGRPSPDLMWLLGFYLGDGLKEEARVIFCAPESDPAEPRIREVLASQFGIRRPAASGSSSG